jgi:capsule polysaccharide export protein KpsC/LpsZ
MTLAKTIAVLSPGIRRIPQLANLLEARIVGRWQRCDAVAGWGLRPTAAAQWQWQRGRPLVQLQVQLQTRQRLPRSPPRPQVRT